MPKRLAVRPGADQIDRMPLLPWLIASPCGDPGKSVDVDLSRGSPLIAAGIGHIRQAERDPMGGDRVVQVERADQLDPPAEPVVSVFDAELEPIEHVRVWSDRPRWLDIRPIGIRRTLPRLRKLAQARLAISLSQPGSKALGGGWAIAVRGRYVALVPNVVSTQAGVMAIAEHQRAQEGARQVTNVFGVEAKARKAT